MNKLEIKTFDCYIGCIWFLQEVRVPCLLLQYREKDFSNFSLSEKVVIQQILGKVILE